MRNWGISGILIVAFLLMPLSVTAAATPFDVKVQVGTELVHFPDAQPFIDSQERLQVPVRFISEQLGYIVDYKKADNRFNLTLTNDATVIELQTGSDKAIVNGQEQLIGTKPLFQQERVYVPMRFVTELRGLSVKWDVDNLLAILHEPDAEVMSMWKAPEWKMISNVKASAYTAAKLENGEYSARDYMGNKLSLGTVAVDPDVIPLGSTLFIEGYDFDGLPVGGLTARATDIGGAVKGKKIDIFLPFARSEALKFGIQTVNVYVLEE